MKMKNYRSVKRESRAHRTLAVKAAEGAMKILPIFEKVHPKDMRPRKAILAIRAWGQGKEGLGMAKVRKLSLDAHAAARAAKTDAARFAARAAGHAVATWHVPQHAAGVPMYADKALNALRMKKEQKKTCSRGHVFMKSSDCPVCPKCWPGRYKKTLSSKKG